METRVGVSGWLRGLTAAVFHQGRLAACEEGRLRRLRDFGGAAGWPHAALEACADTLSLTTLPDAWITGEPAFLSLQPHGHAIDHHEAHARTAFGTSAFDHALVIICDSSDAAPETLWLAHGGTLERVATSRANIAGRFAGNQDARQLEIAARTMKAADPQRRLDRCVDEVRALLDTAPAEAAAWPVCAGGGLFLNGYVNFRLRQHGFDLYVPPDPANGGLAVGCALPAELRGWNTGHALGPAFTDEQVKATLDNCKLRYEYVSSSEKRARAVRALLRGQLVGWFDGPMEWGPRALGQRSIFANPFGAYTSDNLNTFLKHRPKHHTYPVSVLESDLDEVFAQAVHSPFMEAEAVIRNGSPLEPLAHGSSRLRVQTVRDRGSALAELLKAFKTVAGYGALVNTSFNGFHEPIVVTPRDAVRVFFGSGLDALAVGSFWLEK